MAKIQVRYGRDNPELLVNGEKLDGVFVREIDVKNELIERQTIGGPRDYLMGSRTIELKLQVTEIDFIFDENTENQPQVPMNFKAKGRMFSLDE